MLEVTRKVDYAIRSMVFLASRPMHEFYNLSEIASVANLPQNFLAKIFQQLNKKGLARSYRGPTGGFCLERSPDTISLLEIIEAVEGPIVLNRNVAEGSGSERDEFCNVQPLYAEVQILIQDMLQGVTLKDLSQNSGRQNYQCCN